MSKQNKPQWLIDAEKELKKFNNSKYAKMTDQQINAGIGGANSATRQNSELQSKFGKLGGKKGGKKAWQNLVNEVGLEKAKQIKADLLYNNQSEEWKKEFHLKGMEASHAKITKSVNERNLAIIAELPQEFTKKEVGHIVEKYGKKAYYITNIILRHPEMFEKIGVKPRVGRYGKDEIIYRKLA